MTVYWVVWDAAAHWVVSRLEQQDVLPAVRRMRERGQLAAARPARPNCQTPPSLATLFTGTWPAEHGVTGYTVPGAGRGGPGSHLSGFAPRFPAVPPVWETLGARGAYVHVPWVFDGADAVAAHVDAAVEAYSRRTVRHTATEVEPGPAREWLIGPHPVTVEATGDGVRVTGHGEVWLTVGGGWQPLWLTGDRIGTWAACARSGDRLLLVHTGVWRPRYGGADPALLDRMRDCPPFAGEGVGPLYRAGLFGDRLADGGDGTAEEFFLSSVECAVRSFGAVTDAVLAGHDAELVVIYLPMTDDVGHEMLGFCDERSAAYRPDITERIWSLVGHCYRWSDEILGRVLDAAGPDDSVVLGADHGMVGSAYLVHVNDQLVTAGLAVTGADGEVDPDRSAAFYHPANNGALYATGDGLLPRAKAALRELPVPMRFLDPDGRPLADGETGDPRVTFVALHDDYQPTAAVAGAPPYVRPLHKVGAHVVWTGSDRLHAIHAAVGPDIVAGSAPGLIDNTAPARLVHRQVTARAAIPRRRLSLMPVFPHALSPQELTARRYEHVRTFLAGRDLNPGWLSGLMHERVGPGRLLLTSSPVHGLANPTSDLDFIRIQPDPIDGPRISTKIFEDGHHLEVVSFAEGELTSNLDELDRLAALPPGQTVEGIRGWDKKREPRRKQTERIVNGITMDGTAPYLPWLPALATVWSRHSLHLALEQAAYAALAEAAGEPRGRVGYAYNTLLHLMDALLSHHGDVYTTRKWYVLRWTRLVADGRWRDARVQAVATTLESLRKSVAAALEPAAATRPLAGEYVSLALDVARATGTVTGVEVRAEAGGNLMPFLPGATVLIGDGSGVVLPDASTLPLTDSPADLADLAGLDCREAGTLLRALRAGVTRLRITYRDEETAA
ncbi:DUF6001 family protein [Micromonospora sp. WMMA1363]|uniref:DUF6001 family protein n=1 Tax=Micromonospora sp. WMMA1363 TaxID=3053985 RepID=UPI00259CF27A|nr:DUF6001 family protein [Micromonospora sp. WMMA1363]MDM4721526.1 DUF6001 family protein [Micromonospora sp. WMMA1363]